jgi:hypothetical protein
MMQKLINTGENKLIQNQAGNFDRGDEYVY